MKIVVRYIDIYRKDITGKIAKFAAKKYKSYRYIPNTIYKNNKTK